MRRFSLHDTSPGRQRSLDEPRQLQVSPYCSHSGEFVSLRPGAETRWRLPKARGRELASGERRLIQESDEECVQSLIALTTRIYDAAE